MHDTGNDHIHETDICRGAESSHVCDAVCGHEHAHRHVHSDEEKKAVINRLARAAGHLEHVRRMVENDEDCADVLIQLAAVRSAVNGTGRVILHNHINHCLVEAIEEKDMETVERLEEAIKVFVK